MLLVKTKKKKKEKKRSWPHQLTTSTPSKGFCWLSNTQAVSNNSGKTGELDPASGGPTSSRFELQAQINTPEQDNQCLQYC